MATIRTRQRGRTYSYIFEAGWVNGKRKTVEKDGFKTKETAYNAGVEAYADLKHGNIGIVSDHITLRTIWITGCMAWRLLTSVRLPSPSTKR